MKLSLKALDVTLKRAPDSRDRDFTAVDRGHLRNRLAKVSGYGNAGKAKADPSVYKNYPGMSH